MIEEKYKDYDKKGNWIGIKVFDANGELDYVKHLFPWNDKLKRGMPVVVEDTDDEGHSFLKTLYPPVWDGGYSL